MVFTDQVLVLTGKKTILSFEGEANRSSPPEAAFDSSITLRELPRQCAEPYAAAARRGKTFPTGTSAALA